MTGSSDEGGVNETPPTVLVVDDERDLADLYATWLSEDFDVRVAYDGESALAQLDDAVDVVLLDRRMPDLSGDSVLETIRDRSIGCRVAMVTAVEPDMDIIDLGFDDYLQKPVDREQLVSTVNRLNRRASYDQNLQEYFSALRKQSLLDQRLAPSDRSDEEKYQELESRIDDLEARVDDIVDQLDDADFATLFKQME
jgi:DNA-binding response OmpR family regulator